MAVFQNEDLKTGLTTLYIIICYTKCEVEIKTRISVAKGSVITRKCFAEYEAGNAEETSEMLCGNRAVPYNITACFVGMKHGLGKEI